jgi:hypothetical protein
MMSTILKFTRNLFRPNLIHKIDSRIRRAELVVNGVLFGIWNNLSTVINAKTLIDEGHAWAAALNLFFLFFPGLVTSLAFLILYTLGHRRIKRVPPAKVIVYFFVLLFCYPVVPILM